MSIPNLNKKLTVDPTFTSEQWGLVQSVKGVLLATRLNSALRFHVYDGSSRTDVFNAVRNGLTQPEHAPLVLNTAATFLFLSNVLDEIYK